LYPGKLILTEVLLCGLYYTASAWMVQVVEQVHGL